jgi:hypothetical protein
MKKKRKDWMTPEQRKRDTEFWRRLEQRIQEREAQAERRRVSS